MAASQRVQQFIGGQQHHVSRLVGASVAIHVAVHVHQPVAPRPRIPVRYPHHVAVARAPAVPPEHVPLLVQQVVVGRQERDHATLHSRVAQQAQTVVCAVRVGKPGGSWVGNPCGEGGGGVAGDDVSVLRRVGADAAVRIGAGVLELTIKSFSVFI